MQTGAKDGRTRPNKSTTGYRQVCHDALGEETFFQTSLQGENDHKKQFSA